MTMNQSTENGKVVIKSLTAIDQVQNGDLKLLKSEKWLQYLYLTSERNINLERISSMEDMKNNYVLGYVKRSLQALSKLDLTEYQSLIIEETLKWSETAKAGLPHRREQWIRQGFNLYVHNIGSAQIYLKESSITAAPRKESDTISSDDKESTVDTDFRLIVYHLILTHGLIGQYIRGEVSLTGNQALYELTKDGKISASDLEVILYALNYCIVTAVDESIWQRVESRAKETIGLIVNGNFINQNCLKERIRCLRTVSIKNGEDFESEFDKILSDDKIKASLQSLFDQVDLWYVEAALYDFSFSEFVKILLLIARRADLEKVKQVSFEYLMKDIYYQHEGRKRVNIYKKRIIEKYLSEVTTDEILEGEPKENVHVEPEIFYRDILEDTLFFTFRFSVAGNKLIEFCIEAEKSDVLYESAVILLFDLFGLRKDQYDRFYEEESYLQTMNQTIDYKKVILDYITGESIVDIGPGGGALMDLIEATYPNKRVTGVDISQNVLDSLKKKKQLENKKWEVLYGDALNLGQYIEQGSVDTIIFCSILHELFSYIEFQGKKFNHETLAAAFHSALAILPVGGRIIIRDGIMTEPEAQKRIIKFLSEEGMEFLERYAKDFKGREISYAVVGQNEVLMPVNDAMEFLYTYTWGEKSYVHEVNEQFGYFTPGGFKEFITKELGDRAKIIELKHYLQEGYTIALSQKMEIFDENRKPVRLPDSTCIVVIEKVK